MHPNTYIYRYMYIYRYIQAQTHITFMQSLPDEGFENVYVYTFADVYTSVICL